MTADSSDGNVQQNLGILRGEMSGVQKDISRLESKVDAGFIALSTEIKALRDDRNFARGLGFAGLKFSAILTAIIAAAVSAGFTWWARIK